MTTWFEEQLELYRDDPDFKAEIVLLDINEQIVKAMETSGLKRSALAKRLGISRAAVTKMLDGNPNITIKTLCKVAAALGLDVNVQLALPDVTQDAVISFGKPLAPPPAGGFGDDESALAA